MLLVLCRFMGGWLKELVHPKWQGPKMHLLVQVLQNHWSQTSETVAEVNLLAVFPDMIHQNVMKWDLTLGEKHLYFRQMNSCNPVSQGCRASPSWEVCPLFITAHQKALPGGFSHPNSKICRYKYTCVYVYLKKIAEFKPFNRPITSLRLLSSFHYPSTINAYILQDAPG